MVDAPMLLQTSSFQVISSSAPERKIDTPSRLVRDCRWTGRQGPKQSSPDVVSQLPVAKCYFSTFKHPVHMDSRVGSHAMNHL